MSKDKGSKALKKAPKPGDKKDQSDYQAGKPDSYKTEVLSINKKYN
jgi:hypothetical protein